MVMAHSSSENDRKRIYAELVYKCCENFQDRLFEQAS